MNPLFQQGLLLENEHAILLPMTMQHLDGLWPIAAEPDIWSSNVAGIYHKAGLSEYMEKALLEKAAGTGYPFVVIDKKTGRLAGASRYANISDEHKRLEISQSWLGQDFRGTGLNRAFKFEMLCFAFEKLRYNRVELKVNSSNLRSRRAIEKLGASLEGIFRHYMINPAGEARDIAYYSIIAGEWPGIKKRLG